MMSSPLENRVTPWGTIEAHAVRGGWMGNRGGRIHGPDRTLGPRRWASSRWIICVLAFRGRQRVVMGPGYTELFFLDEVTALAAGHRPCFECRRADATLFATLWRACRADADTPRPRGRASAADIDRRLHAERRAPRRMADAGDLPDGAMFALGEQAFAVWQGRAWRWSPEGYRGSGELPSGQVTVLTPQATIGVLSAGYVPEMAGACRPPASTRTGARSCCGN